MQLAKKFTVQHYTLTGRSQIKDNVTVWSLLMYNQPDKLVITIHGLQISY